MIKGSTQIGRVRGAASILAAAIAVCAAFASPAAAKKPPPSFFGISPQTEVTATDYARMSQANFGTLRIAIPWSVADPVAPAGDYDWSASDRIVAGAAAHGIVVQPVLYATPEWVAEGLDGYECGVTSCFLHGPRSEAARSAFSEFAAAAVARYGPAGELWRVCGCAARPIRVWQVWNEQNSGSFYLPKPSPEIYGKLLVAAAGAIRSIDREAEVILGGMAELAGVPKVIPAHEFLERLYEVDRAKASFDGVASHPYGSSLRGVARQVRLLRRVMVASRDRRTGLYVTEIGWSSEEGGNWLNLGRGPGLDDHQGLPVPDHAPPDAQPEERRLLHLDGL